MPASVAGQNKSPVDSASHLAAHVHVCDEGKRKQVGGGERKKISSHTQWPIWLNTSHLLSSYINIALSNLT